MISYLNYFNKFTFLDVKSSIISFKTQFISMLNYFSVNLTMGERIIISLMILMTLTLWKYFENLIKKKDKEEMSYLNLIHKKIELSTSKTISLKSEIAKLENTIISTEDTNREMQYSFFKLKLFFQKKFLENEILNLKKNEIRNLEKKFLENEILNLKKNEVQIEPKKKLKNIIYNVSDTLRNPSIGRIDSSQAWSSSDNRISQHSYYELQLDIGCEKTISGIVTQGRKDCDEWVEKFYIEYRRNDDCAWRRIVAAKPIDDNVHSFRGNNDRNTKVINLFKNPISTDKYDNFQLRIYSTKFKNNISMRSALVIQEIQKYQSLYNINEMSIAEIQEKIPGIGNIIAERIVNRRKDKKFTSIWDLAEIQGLGDGERIRGFENKICF